MKNIKNIFRNLEKKLKQASWFEPDWEIYNRGEYLQLYKANWHNENQGGIHFETYIERLSNYTSEIPNDLAEDFKVNI